MSDRLFLSIPCLCGYLTDHRLSRTLLLKQRLSHPAYLSEEYSTKCHPVRQMKECRTAEKTDTVHMTHMQQYERKSPYCRLNPPSRCNPDSAGAANSFPIFYIQPNLPYCSQKARSTQSGNTISRVYSDAVIEIRTEMTVSAPVL